ncbi:MAG: formate dehydrogenase subunit gamma [Anaerolineae bacterium]
MTQQERATFIRFSLSQRVEHILLMVSFGMLCLTGLPQKFVETGWAEAILRTLGGITTARTIHHIFAFMLAFQFLYHLVVVLYELVFVHPGPTAMLPGVKDVKDGLHSVAFLVGRRAEKPKFGRYDFRQKVEYWAMMWGLVIMGLTGFFLMFPILFSRYLPGILIPAAKVVHGYEAILAFLAIVTWHFYNAHLASGVFPLDTSIFTGKITWKRLMEEHPLEYQRLVLAETQPPKDDATEMKEA